MVLEMSLTYTIAILFRASFRFLRFLWGFPGGSEVKASACSAGDPGSIPDSGRSPGEGNGNPLQYSCLENPIDGGAQQATVHCVTKSRTRLSNFTFTFRLLQMDHSVNPQDFRIKPCHPLWITILLRSSLCFATESWQTLTAWSWVTNVPGDLSQVLSDPLSHKVKHALKYFIIT